MGRFILIDVVVAGTLCFLWYAWFVRYNRRRAADVLRWVQAACRGKGQVLDLRWQASSSRLKATLHLSSRWFDDARLTIRLLPRPLPVQWALSRYRQQQETLTFEADMGFPQASSLTSSVIAGRATRERKARPALAPGPSPAPALSF